MPYASGWCPIARSGRCMGEARPPLRNRLRTALRTPHGRAAAAALVALAILLGIGWPASRWYEATLLSEHKAQAAVRASLRGNALSLAIGRRFALLQGLHAYVQAAADKPDLENEFQVFAAELYRTPSARGVRNVALAPAGTTLYCVAFADHGDVLRIISLRRATRREVKHYVKTT